MLTHHLTAADMAAMLHASQQCFKGGTARSPAAALPALLHAGVPAARPAALRRCATSKRSAARGAAMIVRAVAAAPSRPIGGSAKTGACPQPAYPFLSS